jgi:hypothetical protein
LVRTILLLARCGLFALTAIPVVRSPTLAADPPPADSDAEKLVRQLGSKSFRDRETSQATLLTLGAKAKAAVLAGSKDSDEEV